MDIYSNIDVSTDDDIYFLKLFGEYDEAAKRMPSVVYADYTDKGMEDIREKFRLEVIDKQDAELKFIMDLKKKAVNLFWFDGEELGEKKYDELSVIDIIDQAKKDNKKLNCRYRAYIFLHMLLACGIKARMVSCMSMDLRYSDCHWVTEVFIEKLKKWIVVDVAMDYIYFDERGLPLNLFEIRDRILNNKRIKFFSTNVEHILFTQEYWKKNIFRFRFVRENTCNFLRGREIYFMGLNPKRFVMKNKVYTDNNRQIHCQYYYNATGIWEDC